MKTHRSTMLIVVLLMGLLLSAAVTAAQSTGTLTYTEADINTSYRVTNPARSSLTYTESELNQAYIVTNPRRQTISNSVVDLQPGQVVISAIFTPARGNALETVTTLVPEINNGQPAWTVISITADGAPATSITLAQVNTAIVNSWVAHWRQNLGLNALTAIVILDDTITYTYSQ